MKSLLLAAALLLLPFDAALGQERIFDSHVHLWHGEASLREYEAQLKAANLSIAGFGGMWFGGPNQAPPGEIDKTRASNDAQIALAEKHPEMLPIATVHPYDGQSAIAELERVAGRGIKVLKLHPHTQKFDVRDPRVAALAKRAGELGVIVLMDNANILPGDSENLFNLAVACPRTKFIFAHMGGLNFRFWNILALARTAQGFFADNIYFDISATTVIAAGSPIQNEFVWTIRNVGVDHLLLGSDFPQLTLPQTLAAFERLGLTDAERASITFGNAQRLFGLKYAFSGRSASSFPCNYNLLGDMAEKAFASRLSSPGPPSRKRALEACALAVSRLCWGAMGHYSDERAIWLGRYVLPHEPALRSWLRRRRLEGLEIDDVIQETYTRLVAAESVAHIRDAKSYAFQIAGSVVVDHLRRLKVVSIASVSDLDQFDMPSDEPSPERQVIDRDELQRLAETIARLPGKIRDVFTLRRVHGLSQREVAARLGLAESTVEKHMARGFLLMLEPLRHGGKDSAQTSSFGSGKIGPAHDRKDRTSD